MSIGTLVKSKVISKETRSKSSGKYL